MLHCYPQFTLRILYTSIKVLFILLVLLTSITSVDAANQPVTAHEPEGYVPIPVGSATTTTLTTTTTLRSTSTTTTSSTTTSSPYLDACGCTYGPCAPCNLTTTTTLPSYIDACGCNAYYGPCPPCTPTTTSTTIITTTTTTTSVCSICLCICMGSTCGCLRAGRGGCFAPESKILMADGRSKPISEIGFGEYVMNPITGKAVRVDKVVVGEESLPLIELVYKNEKLKVTKGHPIVIRDRSNPFQTEIIKASSVVYNDEVIGADGQFYRLQSIKELAPQKGQIVYNLQLDATEDPQEHLLLADGIVTGDLWLQEQIASNSAEQNSLVEKLIAGAR